jgi:hypothetical protein
MSVVTISTKFPNVGRERRRDDAAEARRRPARPRSVSRSEMRRLVEETLEDLDVSLCSFWACPGPDKPTVPMATCTVCYRIKRLRVLREWLEGDL